MKKILTAVVICCMAMCSVCAFADGDTAKITGVYTMTGKLYYCDPPTSSLVITDVSPVSRSNSAALAAKETEYKEIRISPDCMRMSDGSAVALDDLNNYADSEVWFVAVKDNAGNLMIPYLQFK